MKTRNLVIEVDEFGVRILLMDYNFSPDNIQSSGIYESDSRGQIHFLILDTFRATAWRQLGATVGKT